LTKAAAALPCLTLLAALAAVVAPALAQTSPPRFVMACAPCHGFDGIGHDAATPNLAGQQAIYLYKQMAAFRIGARKHPEMNFFSGQMTQEEMRAIAEYYSRLVR
jgi:cytochrome c553